MFKVPVPLTSAPGKAALFSGKKGQNSWKYWYKFPNKMRKFSSKVKFILRIIRFHLNSSVKCEQSQIWKRTELNDFPCLLFYHWKPRFADEVCSFLVFKGSYETITSSVSARHCLNRNRSSKMTPFLFCAWMPK